MRFERCEFNVKGEIGRDVKFQREKLKNLKFPYQSYT